MMQINQESKIFFYLHYENAQIFSSKTKAQKTGIGKVCQFRDINIISKNNQCWAPQVFFKPAVHKSATELQFS